MKRSVQRATQRCMVKRALRRRGYHVPESLMFDLRALLRYYNARRLAPRLDPGIRASESAS